RPEVGQKGAHPTVDVVDDPPDRLEILSGRVVDGPVLITLAGEHGAGFTAAQGDDDVGPVDQVDVELGRRVIGDGQAAFGQHLGDDRVDAGAGFRPGRAHLDGVAGVVPCEHLRGDGATGVVDAG